MPNGIHSEIREIECEVNEQAMKRYHPKAHDAS